MHKAIRKICWWSGDLTFFYLKFELRELGSYIWWKMRTKKGVPLTIIILLFFLGSHALSIHTRQIGPSPMLYVSVTQLDTSFTNFLVAQREPLVHVYSNYFGCPSSIVLHCYLIICYSDFMIAKCVRVCFRVGINPIKSDINGNGKANI